MLRPRYDFHFFIFTLRVPNLQGSRSRGRITRASVRKILGTFLRTIASPKLAGGGQGGVEIRRGIEVVGGPCRRFLFFFPVSGWMVHVRVESGPRGVWVSRGAGRQALIAPCFIRIPGEFQATLPGCCRGVTGVSHCPDSELSVAWYGRVGGKVDMSP